MGRIIYYKKKLQSDELSEKEKGIHINHFIYKLVNKDILKYKLSKTDVLSDLWQHCNTGSAICDCFSHYMKNQFCAPFQVILTKHNSSQCENPLYGAGSAG